MWIRSGLLVGARKAIATATEPRTLSQIQQAHARAYTHVARRHTPAPERPLSLRISRARARQRAHDSSSLSLEASGFADLVYRPVYRCRTEAFRGTIL